MQASNNIVTPDSKKRVTAIFIFSPLFGMSAGVVSKYSIVRMCSQAGDVKEFLRGFVAEITIDPNAARGTITYYELPISSLM